MIERDNLKCHSSLKDKKFKQTTIDTKGIGQVLGIQLVTGDDPGWFGILRTPRRYSCFIQAPTFQIQYGNAS